MLRRVFALPGFNPHFKYGMDHTHSILQIINLSSQQPIPRENDVLCAWHRRCFRADLMSCGTRIRRSGLLRGRCLRYFARCPDLEPMCSCGPTRQIGGLKCIEALYDCVAQGFRKRFTSSSLVPPLSSPDVNTNFIASRSPPSV